MENRNPKYVPVDIKSSCTIISSYKSNMICTAYPCSQWRVPNTDLFFTDLKGSLQFSLLTN